MVRAARKHRAETAGDLAALAAEMFPAPSIDSIKAAAAAAAGEWRKFRDRLCDTWPGPIPPRRPRAGVWWRATDFDRRCAYEKTLFTLPKWVLKPIRTIKAAWADDPTTPGERNTWNEGVQTAADQEPILTHLDPDQRRAAVCLEDRAFVTAGAGSGKTRTMIARANYTAAKTGCKLREIAFVTFTTKARDEIIERTKTESGQPGVGTIHHLARRVLALTGRPKIELTPLAGDDEKRKNRIAGWLDEALRGSPDLLADKQLRINAGCSTVKPDGTKTESHRIPPDGRLVKSHGEVVIGTLLHASGTAFKYEQELVIPEDAQGGEIGGGEMKVYRPDFYLPDDPDPDTPATLHGGVWLEHYAHDRRGRAPEEFKNYDKEREWKRTIHRRLKTRYIETSFGDLQRSWDGDPPGIAHVLAGRLRGTGIAVSDPSTWNTAESGEKAKPRASYKERADAAVIEEIDAWIRARRQKPPGPERPIADPVDAALRRLGKEVLKRYEAHLRDTGTTDHEGTILEGLEAARTHPGLLPWKHVIVDEYQDVNPAQAAFVHALTMPPGPYESGATLAAVGDDWQSIMGFQGGDPGLIRTGRDPGGNAGGAVERIILKNGYRFGQALADTAKALVTAGGANPPRETVGCGPAPGAAGGAPVHTASCEATEDGRNLSPKSKTRTTGALIAALARWIPPADNTPGTESEPRTVLVMGRRNLDIKNPEPGNLRMGVDQKRVQAAAKLLNLVVGFSTVHKAKGREADYAVLIDSGPSRRAEDSRQKALTRAIEAETGIAGDDDLRLWYVAVTRGKYGSLVLVTDPDGGASASTQRLIDGQEPGMYVDNNALDRWLEPVRPAVPCPGCNPEGTEGGGRLRGRQGPRQHFAGCSEWSKNGAGACSYTQPSCTRCGTGILKRNGRWYECQRHECNGAHPVCRCGSPRPMVKRVQKATGNKFWGCWRFSEHGSCRRTLNC